jgi:hypothetical protein
MIGFIDALLTHFGTKDNTALSLFPHFIQITVTHALGICPHLSYPGNGCTKCHCNFNSHMKSSLHRVIPFLQLFCNYQFRGLDSIQFFCFQTHVLAGSRLETRLCSILLLPASELFFIITLRGPRRKHNLCIVGKTCLQLCFIATKVTRLLLPYLLHRELVYRVVA